MMDLGLLSPRELSLLGRKTAQACGIRFAEIARLSDRQDRPLQALLKSMAAETRDRAQLLKRIAGSRGVRPSGLLNVRKLRDLVRRAIATLSKSLGEGTLHRDAALYFAESLREELGHFYGLLAQHAPHAAVRRVCYRLSEHERSAVRFLREVVL